MQKTLDVQRDHENMIEKSMKLLNKDGMLLFSTNRKGGKGSDDIYQFYLPPIEFNIEGVGQAGLKIIEKEPFKLIKITSDGKSPFSFLTASTPIFSIISFLSLKQQLK